ncbi:MltA domain-containing protein [Aquabacterium sp.]|uniref:murein transglycosylase A n=1 Tax=Aquabacterium sp. TaxID=1872578 RepID=UPI002489550F|nr:MltA domain-containing protein [Aquabacterium sp.]MDI1261610.1 MltA domain-containing protein [Aquabacterium sp.]
MVHQFYKRATAALMVGSLAACSSGPSLRSSAPIVSRAPTVAPGTVLPQPDGRGDLVRPRALWTPAQYTDLPGWAQDRVSESWPALWQSCQRPGLGWATVCAEVRELGADWGRQVADDFVRQWLEGHLRPWRLNTLDGQTSGLLTGYFEPFLDVRRTPDARYKYPLYRAPADLGVRKPHFTRAELDSLPEARASVMGRELVYVSDPLDALLIQVQGSGRVRVQDELNAQGQPRTVRLAFAGHNDQPYQSVARWLVDQGAFSLEQASWPAIRTWALQNPQRVPEMLRANPRMVFFKEEPLLDPQVGPVGAQGVPLIPGRSVAVDREAVPLGTPMWLDSTVPQPWNPTPPAPQSLQRLVVAQDTGGAIIGGVRADYFWGWGDEALAQAGRTKQPMSAWVLWPR